MTHEVKRPATPYIGPERRTDMRIWRDQVDKRLDAGTVSMKAMQAELAANTNATKQVQADTGEVVELLKSFKGAFAVFDLVGRVAKPAAAITALVVGLWSFISAVKGGK